MQSIAQLHESSNIGVQQPSPQLAPQSEQLHAFSIGGSQLPFGHVGGH
jgi:hypothetical protein